MFPGGLTYSGHPLAAASIVAALTAMAEEGVVEHAARIGAEHLGPGLAALAEQHEVIGEVRGTGVFWALELVSDRTAKTPLDSATMARLKSELIGRGLLPFVVDNRIHLVPPAVITAEEVQRGLSLLGKALDAISR